MPDEDIEKLVKNLSPQEKIKKLKELQKKNQEEIEKATKLLKKSEEEAQREEEIKKIPVPQMRAENIEELFSAEEKEMFQARRMLPNTRKLEEKEEKKKKSLEESAEEVEIKKEQRAQAEVQYVSQMAKAPAEKLYSRMKELYSEVKESGYMSSEQRKEMDELHYANAKKMQDIEAGRYHDVTKEAAREMVLTEKMRGFLNNAYGRKTDY